MKINESISRINFKELLNNGYLTYYMCLASMIIMPLHVDYLPPFMILWGLFWLFENRFIYTHRIFENSTIKTLFVLFILFYTWQIIGLVYANLLDVGIDRILKRLSFILFPLVLFYPGKMILKNLNKLLKIFVISTFIFILYSFCYALFKSLSIQSGHLIFNPNPPFSPWENYFFGYHLSNYIHPSYFSMYVVLAVLISLDQIFTESIKSFERAIWIILIIIFVLTIYFLSSRAGVIAVLIVVPVYMYNKIKKKMMRLILIIFFPIFIFSVFVLLKTNTRFYYSFEKIIDRKPGKIIIKDQRLQIWKSAIGVIKRNLIIGVGTGDATYELKKEFKKRGYTEGYYENLNAHNQYLEVFLENGLIGLIIFLGTMGFMLYHAFVNQNIIYGLSIIMVMIFFIFETMLNRLAGVTFFPLFSFLLFHLNVGNKNSDFKENSSQS